MSDKSHWDTIYSTKPADKRSWSQSRPAISPEWIQACAPGKRDLRLIDVGGGASNLVDTLLDEGYTNLTVLDLSRAALDEARARLGPRSNLVKWIEADVTEFKPDDTYDVWHDRAVFHFLTQAADRGRYVATLAKALKPGAHAIIGTFSLDGPEKCSGLEVVRYDEQKLALELGAEFRLIKSTHHVHTTPWGSKQAFLFCLFERR